MYTFPVPYRFASTAEQRRAIETSTFVFKPNTPLRDMGEVDYRGRELAFDRIDNWGRYRFKVKSKDGDKYLARTIVAGLRNLMMKIPDRELKEYF